MTLIPVVESNDMWRRQDILEQLAARLRERSLSVDGIPSDALFENPVNAITENSTIRVKTTDRSLKGCSVDGLYRPDPPTITLARTGSGRDNFTVLHEFAHHLQAYDEEWQDILWQVGRPLRGWIEESLCDVYASTVLIPDQLLDPTAELSSQALSSLFDRTQASRQAVLTRVVRSYGDGGQLFAVVCDLSGRVEFGMSTNDALAQPPRGLVQPDIGRLISKVLEDGSSSGRTNTTSEIVYSTGATRDDVLLDVSLAGGTYAFVVGRKFERYADDRWSVSERVCPSDACNEEFAVTAGSERCLTCTEPICPSCRRCDCASERAPAGICPRCRIALYPADVAAGRSEHDECF
ncbi:hypothetical protein CH249_12530 [Rhodococcus sp. 05-2255-3B1]|uniref:ImmA/IrrE family metallo-endopeptidase n=1 Tax=unclassified Rhodococcus (in: high G+C Gram-positive bacteria) TaxID=192944 RepID=UPI000B9B3A7A|nr:MULTISPECIES: hypothetical protein [unclassified Rhodococcus (in: high G+C Gram-positive bacteria)]OZE04009.1 hypothetical protein CH250_21160 [Rhodococcus sp. 05-2255-3C]OZE10603.1 hypothetical protein CH249_12530 [Rhodococcus sp. 05-2255-3B1]OZE20678.1 hypothetical protein CH255_08700 [Rhodococcus sp. 05-2255-2A2]